MTKKYTKSGTKEYIGNKKKEFIHNIELKKKNKILIYITNSIKISYWRATTIAPIKATKRIIEISSNGRKKSVDK